MDIVTAIDASTQKHKSAPEKQHIATNYIAANTGKNTPITTVNVVLTEPAQIKRRTSVNATQQQQIINTLIARNTKILKMRKINLKRAQEQRQAILNHI